MKVDPREPCSLFCLYILQSFSRIGPHSEICLIPFHSRPQSQGFHCRTIKGQRKWIKNPKVFACSHETFATLKKIFVFACLRGTAFLNSCKSYEVPSHRTRQQSGPGWITAAQLKQASVSWCLVCRVYTICIIIDYLCVFSESTKWFAVTCSAPCQQLWDVALSPSCRWPCSNRYTAATGRLKAVKARLNDMQKNQSTTEWLFYSAHPWSTFRGSDTTLVLFILSFECDLSSPCRSAVICSDTAAASS